MKPHQNRLMGVSIATRLAIEACKSNIGVHRPWIDLHGLSEAPKGARPVASSSQRLTAPDKTLRPLRSDARRAGDILRAGQRRTRSTDDTQTRQSDEQYVLS